MNHIIKPFKPYFNTPLEPRRTQGMIAYYDATTQQGGGYLADRYGRRHGVFANNPTWQNGNAITGLASSNQRVQMDNIPSLVYPYTILAITSFPSLPGSGVFLGLPVSGYSSTYPSWGHDDGFTSIILGVTSEGQFGIPISYLSINKYYQLAVVATSASDVRIFCDGIRLNFSPYFNNIGYLNTLNSIIFGARYNSGYSRTSNFNFKQLAIFNRALTHGEILAHYEDQYCFYEQPKIYGFIPSGGGSSLPAIINNHRQQGAM